MGGALLGYDTQPGCVLRVCPLPSGAEADHPATAPVTCASGLMRPLTMDCKPPHVLGIPNKGGMQLEGKSGDGRVTEKDSALGSKGKDRPGVGLLGGQGSNTGCGPCPLGTISACLPI